jgi:hypothetical protein
MEKSFARAFIFSLIIFFVLNFLIYVISYAIGGILDLLFGPIAAHPTQSVYLLIYPTRFFPWELINRAISASIAFKIYYLGGIASYVIAAIVAGLTGGSIAKSFGGWILTAICSMLLFILIVILDAENLDFISFSATLIDGIVLILITGTVNALIFGALVILIALIKGRE